MRIELQNTTAIVVDYQERLLPVIAENEKLIQNSEILIRGLRTLGVPLCVTQQYTKGLGMTAPEIQEAVGNKDYLEKISFSSYDAVAEVIQGKKHVVLCGIETHICVLQTVIDLAAHGYVPVLVTDCVSSRKPEDKKAGIKRAMQEGAIVTTYEAILFELLKEAGTPVSKEIQKLVK